VHRLQKKPISSDDKAIEQIDPVILAVKHTPIAKMGDAGIKALLAPGGSIYDLRPEALVA
jgi:hypothetical protein